MTNEQMQAVLLQMQQQNQLIMTMLQESSKGQQNPDQAVRPVRMELLTKAGKKYGLSYQFMKRLCADDKVRYVRSGRRTLVNMESLEDYLRRGEGGAG